MMHKKYFILLVLLFITMFPALNAFIAIITNFKGCKRKDVYLMQIDNYNHLTWSVPNEIIFTPAMRTPFNSSIAYQIYRVNITNGVAELIATVPGSGILEYDDHDLDPSVNYTYYIVAIDGFGDLSEPASTTVTESC